MSPRELRRRIPLLLLLAALVGAMLLPRAARADWMPAEPGPNGEPPVPAAGDPDVPTGSGRSKPGMRPGPGPASAPRPTVLTPATPGFQFELWVRAMRAAHPTLHRFLLPWS